MKKKFYIAKKNQKKTIYILTVPTTGANHNHSAFDVKYLQIVLLRINTNNMIISKKHGIHIIVQ